MSQACFCLLKAFTLAVPLPTSPFTHIFTWLTQLLQVLAWMNLTTLLKITALHPPPPHPWYSWNLCYSVFHFFFLPKLSTLLVYYTIHLPCLLFIAYVPDYNVNSLRRGILVIYLICQDSGIQWKLNKCMFKESINLSDKQRFISLITPSSCTQLVEKWTE